MKTIWLTRGAVAFVDDADFALIARQTWYCTKQGYAARKPDRECFLMHRELMKAPRGVEVDHINGDTLDNQRSNLRLCTHTQNMRNRRRNARSRSRFKGVTCRFGPKWPKNNYVAEIRLNGKSTYLGIFATEEIAAKAYDEAAREYHGEFARLNFPDAKAVA